MAIDDIGQPSRIAVRARFLPRFHGPFRDRAAILQLQIEFLRERSRRAVADGPERADERTGAAAEKRARESADAREFVSGPARLAGIQNDDWSGAVARQVRVSFGGCGAEVIRDVFVAFDPAFHKKLCVCDIALVGQSMTSEVEQTHSFLWKAGSK